MELRRMQIKSIYIKGMKKQDREVRINLSGLNVSVIYGDNGCGKTTLLRLINAILAQQDSVLLNENVEEVIIEYLSKNNEEEKVSIKKVESAIQFYKNKQETLESQNVTAVGYDWSELKQSELSSMTSILFGVNRGITNSVSISADYLYSYIMRTRYIDYFKSREDIHMFCESLSRNINMNQRRRRGINIRDRYDFSEPVLTIDDVDMNVIEELLVGRYNLAQKVSVARVQKALFDTLAAACNSLSDEVMVDNDLENMLLLNREKLVNTLRQMERNTLSDKIISILRGNDIDVIVAECKNNILLSRLIVNMSIELEKEEVILQSIGTLQEVFNEYIGPDKYIEISENEILVKFHNSKETHTIHNLSSGEKHLLVLLTVFIIQGRQRNLLMIDEPEISLNITWQRKLMPLLSELAPEAQIIVASHSPSIAKANTRFLVELR